MPSRPPEDPAPPAGHRIAKLLARAGVASRREIERMIAEGRVARGGIAIDTPATLLASLDGVTVDGEPVAPEEPTRLFLFHKPAGVLTAERDFSGRPTIYDRLPPDLPRLVPVGRLDLNTEGLLLLTTDGGFKRELELPSTGVERAYRARAYGKVSQPELEALIDGVEIEGVRYGPIDANIERRTGANLWIEMVLREGKNREVRRVLEHLGLRVSRLIRIRYGPFVLGDLPVGGIGEVRAADLATFRRTLAQPGSRTELRVSAPATPARPVAPVRAAVAARPGPPRGRPGPMTRIDSKRATGPRAPAVPAPPPPAADEETARAPGRPARPPQRKAGWARPKPKAGPRRPAGKPRR